MLRFPVERYDGPVQGAWWPHTAAATADGAMIVGVALAAGAADGGGPSEGAVYKGAFARSGAPPSSKKKQ